VADGLDHHDELAPDRSLDQPHPRRLPPGTPGRAAILAAHRAAMDRGEPGYTDPVTGLFVFTAASLAERGTCCDTGCRHCPYLV
jgi:hypothetical protein